MNSNPLLDGLAQTREPGAFALVIFGATGDLTKRKLIPGLFSLFLKGIISQFKIIGFARRPWTHESFQEEGRKMLNTSHFRQVPQGQKEAFIQKLAYISSTFDGEEGYKQLEAACEGYNGRIYYLSTPPDEYPAIIDNLGKVGAAHFPQGGYSRIIVEKPFGRDLATAKALNAQLSVYFSEDQIYRIDHYLGKETVQNVMVLRFGNGIFEPLWNSQHIDHIQITVAESLGVGSRGNYYEKSGALRDMVQNHIFQFLCLLTMEPPSDLSPDSIRNEKVKVLKSLRPITHKEVKEYTVRGQYTKGYVDNKEMPGYKEEVGVSPDSHTETFVALKVFIDNWRWAGVPIFIRSAKGLTRKLSEAAIVFKDPPHQVFKTRPDELGHNSLVIHIQPEEGITFTVNAKIPGYTTQVRPVNMDFAYGNAFGEHTPEAYERLLLDCMVGDSTLYTRKDEIEASWTYITRILQGWQADPEPPLTYTAGSSGPEGAKKLMAGTSRKWRKL
ncbi:MAG: glucose-6-phosphate dehydrogenase [Spirochaetes bacterium GWB1_48_6]|nr:MAG: glucose-6-phosphate dehydrogenase [Spirochaetes bacterium GWB1_48_6]